MHSTKSNGRDTSAGPSAERAQSRVFFCANFPMFSIPHAPFQDPNLSAYSLMAIIAVARAISLAGAEERRAVTMDQMARSWHVRMEDIARGISEARKAGYIRLVRPARKHQNAMYQLTIPSSKASAQAKSAFLSPSDSSSPTPLSKLNKNSEGERKGSGGVQRGRGNGQPAGARPMVVPPQPTKQDTYPVYEDAAKILGNAYAPTTGHGKAILRRITRLLKQNYTKADLILAVKEAKRRIEAGNHWSRLRSLGWIWGNGLLELIEEAKAGQSTTSRVEAWAKTAHHHHRSVGQK